MPISIAIVDDHPLAINGLSNMLAKAKKSILVQNTYLNGKALLDGLKTQVPDVLLMDLQLPDIGGEQLAEIITQSWPAIQIIVITSLDAPIHIRTMMRKGCKGYLLKNVDLKTLTHAIEQVHEGQEFIQPELKEQMVQHMLQVRKNIPTLPTLTRREQEILQLISEELTNAEIADKLHVSLRTVEKHRFTLMQKLDSKNTAGLVKVGLKLGLIS